jgi:hypothetical protein
VTESFAACQLAVFFGKLASMVIEIVTAIATIFLVLVTHRLFVATKRLADISREMNALASSSARSETDAMLIGAVNAVNAIVLGDDRNLRAADKLIAHGGLDTSEESARERWIAFVLLNLEQLFFIERSAGGFSEKFWQTSSRQILDRLLANPHVVQLVQTSGYHPDFVAYCSSRIANLKELSRSRDITNR